VLEDEPVSVSLRRICCSWLDFASKSFGTDYKTLRNLGVVEDRDHYEEWKEVFTIVNTNDCTRAGGRCMKAVDKDGNKIC
jgi:hypothetical protein